jgi:hypothetical protein
MAIIVITVQAFLKERKSRPCPYTVYILFSLCHSERKALLQKLLCKPLPAPLNADNTLWSPVLAAWTNEGCSRAPNRPSHQSGVLGLEKGRKSSLISVMAAAQHIFRTQGETHSAAFEQVQYKK